MKHFWFLLLAIFSATVAPAQERDGNFTIRFEPTVVLQAQTEVPFSIVVIDPLRKPVDHARVTLQIKSHDGMDVKDFRATMTGPGSYVAKPVFASGGAWSVYVEVRRDQDLSARNIMFQVAP